MLTMRVVPSYEKKKRGCQYCKNSGRIRTGGGIRTGCPFDECPYHVLDKYDTYEQFMASEDSKILVDEFFQTVASCYELSNGGVQVKRIFSDGDATVHL